jgi:hypothetical protein
MAKLTLSKGAIQIQRGRDANDEPMTFVLVQIQPRLEIAKGIMVPVPMLESDVKFTATELSTEAQAAVTTLLAEVEARIKATATEKAKKLATDAGVTFEG